MARILIVVKTIELKKEGYPQPARIQTKNEYGDIKGASPLHVAKILASKQVPALVHAEAYHPGLDFKSVLQVIPVEITVETACPGDLVQAFANQKHDYPSAYQQDTNGVLVKLW